ncbi:hypothetical protein XHV734_2537 [Xanthomonas hortorum pv. vitians]|nr:hypothetical protein XHV734_2537 [Xanthomonas hortorum pv. vitians]
MDPHELRTLAHACTRLTPKA